MSYLYPKHLARYLAQLINAIVLTYYLLNWIPLIPQDSLCVNEIIEQVRMKNLNS